MRKIKLKGGQKHKLVSNDDSRPSPRSKKDNNDAEGGGEGTGSNAVCPEFQIWEKNNMSANNLYSKVVENSLEAYG